MTFRSYSEPRERMRALQWATASPRLALGALAEDLERGLERGMRMEGLDGHGVGMNMGMGMGVGKEKERDNEKDKASSEDGKDWREREAPAERGRPRRMFR